MVIAMVIAMSQSYPLMAHHRRMAAMKSSLRTLVSLAAVGIPGGFSADVHISWEKMVMLTCETCFFLGTINHNEPLSIGYMGESD